MYAASNTVIYNQHIVQRSSNAAQYKVYFCMQYAGRNEAVIVSLFKLFLRFFLNQAVGRGFNSINS